MANPSDEKLREYASNLVVWFYQKKQSFENQKRAFEENKAHFEKEMAKYYELLLNEDGEAVIYTKDTLYDIARIKLTKVSSVKLDFDTKGIKSALQKSDRKAVIKKTYTITDWPGLFELLKSHNVDFKEFMKYASVKEEVVPEQLERLVDLGKVKEDDIRQYISVKRSSTYYKMTGK